jgi:general secretion pathway protein G
VVVIIGIIAAIAVPRLGSGSQGAGESALLGSLAAMRNAIDRYAAEHGGAFPGAVADGLGGAAGTALAFTNQLTLSSDAQGGCSTTPAAGFGFGPYLRRIPPVPVGPNSSAATIAIDSTNSPPLVTGGSEAWVYNPTTGEILANPDSSNIDGTRTYDEY